MAQLSLSKISLAELRSFVSIQEFGVQPYPWLQVDGISLTEAE